MGDTFGTKWILGGKEDSLEELQNYQNLVNPTRFFSNNKNT